MGYVVEKAFDIRLYHIAINPILEVEGEGTDRIQRTPFRAIAITATQEILFVNCL